MYPEPKLIASRQPTSVENLRPTVEAISEARQFLDWVREQGVTVPGGNWIARTAAGYEKVLAAPDHKRQSVYSSTFPNTGELQYNLADILQLNSIQKNIGEQDPVILCSKLSDVVRGPNSQLDEHGQNTLSRNTRFELFMASLFNSSGYKAVLCEPNPDVMLKRGHKTNIGLECKRAFSAKTLLPLIAAANKQFRERPGNADLKANILAIDVTRAITQGKWHLGGESIAAANRIRGIVDKLFTDTILPQFRQGKYDFIDAMIFVYHDHVQPDPNISMTLHGILQILVADNPRAPRKRKRLAIRFLLPLSKRPLS